MRFLCFHGMGTNGKGREVFRADGLPEKIRQQLGREHEFIFLDGTIPCHPSPGMPPAAGGCYRFAGTKCSDLQELYDGLVRFVQTKGPFDGVMGFSEGGSVAAGALIEDAVRPFGQFKCGIFFSAAVPADPLPARQGHMRVLNVAEDGILINVATAHIWSDSGTLCPAMGSDLMHLCNPSLRSEHKHDLGHDIPGSRSDGALTGTLRAIERTIERARTK